ncbi:MAG: PFL family protein [Lentisphaeria bacterium]|nr:PFL family protein [Lentisphaeria bacterium]MBR7127586.1 PFL family protein [Lentisphaeria bacterium]
MVDIKDILETLNMIHEECLDIRTVTMGISLYDCQSDDEERLVSKVYDKVMLSAEKLVPTAEAIEKKYGIPIINKRVAVTPVSLLCGNLTPSGAVKIAKTLDRAASNLGINFIGGYSALVQKGFTNGARTLIKSIPEALTVTEKVCSSVNVASTKAGINMDAIAQMGDIIKETAYLTRDRNSIGCAKLVVFANAPEDNPFMAGAFHGIGEPETVINVGVSGPGVVASAIRRAGDCSLNDLADLIKKTAFKITRVGQLVASEAANNLGVPFGIVDLSLAPTPAIGDSVAYILESMGLEQCGCPGTTAALAMLNDAVKKGGVMASSQVGGLSGAFIPVSEDAGMIAAAESGSLSLEKLEAMTAVCSVGLDMIAIPGDTPSETISGIIADEIAIGVVNNKTTAARLIPAYNCKVGDKVEFGGLLGTAPIMAVKTPSPAKFVKRGGHIPAPIHSLKN